MRIVEKGERRRRHSPTDPSPWVEKRYVCEVSSKIITKELAGNLVCLQLKGIYLWIIVNTKDGFVLLNQVCRFVWRWHLPGFLWPTHNNVGNSSVYLLMSKLSIGLLDLLREHVSQNALVEADIRFCIIFHSSVSPDVFSSLGPLQIATMLLMSTFLT